MLASLAGGASCGPSNPLQQLSKTYGADRGVSQDHNNVGATAGSSHTFRQLPSSSSPGASLPQDPSAQHFFQLQARPSSHPFDLSPLDRALSPSGSSVSPAPPPPAWATAFQQQPEQEQHHAPTQLEQELFTRVFGPRASEGHAWRSEFAHERSQAGPSRQEYQQSVPVPVHATRLYGQGIVRQGSAMQPGPLAFLPQPMQQEQHEARELQGRHEWETAFLAQDSASSASLSAADTADASFQTVTETRALTPPLRAHTPLSDPTARDVLAQTAANLLSAVQSSEEQRTRDASTADQTSELGAKFAQSSFLSLMRQLRDGEVAVEGDRVVEQVGPYAALSAKGKERADGWASDFTANLQREEEGRVNAAVSSSVPPIFAPGAAVEQVAKAQHAWADRQAQSAQFVRELQEGYSTLQGMWDDEDRVRAAREKGQGKERAKDAYPLQFQGDGGGVTEDEEMTADGHVPLAQSSWEEDLDDPAFIAGGHAPGLAHRTIGGNAGPSAQQREWDMLQQDWDNFEVTATGLKPKNAEASTSSTSFGYSFVQNNPYLQQRAFSTRQHAFHDAGALSSALLERHDSLLQHEANVQQDPSSAAAWLALGLKQQQNEREDLAIAALRRAIELDSSVATGAAHLALAISFTNEGRRFEAYDELDAWASSLAANADQRVYRNEIERYRDLFGRQLPTSMQDRHEYLSGLLIRLAQSRATQEGAAGVDADVQVALGVLFNSSEEWEKAQDCFEAALSVRPDDPLLYNRLGATYANSGKTNLAIQYYEAALDVEPGYVRARYNLAVANMNLGQYEDAVHHLLTSLSIQEADAQQGHLEQAPVADQAGGITSRTLWDSLNVSLLQMHRTDLSPLATQRDLFGLMQAFA
ncbi:hypothetical protein JCM11641_003154 [Rhodosporidiobolus odoratus]